MKKLKKVANFIIRITSECNKQCKHCYNQLKRDHLNKTSLHNIASFIFLYPEKDVHIVFSGGEPLLKFENISRMVNECNTLAAINNKRVDYTLLSNLSLINESMLDFIVKHKIFVVASMDGNFKAHNLSKGFQRSEYTHVFKYFSLLKKHGLLALSPTIDKEFGATPDEIIKLYNQLGLNEVYIRPNLNLGYKNTGLYVDDHDFFFDFWKKFNILSKRMGMCDSRCISYKKRLNLTNSCPQFSLPCKENSVNVVIDTNGDVYPCDESIGASAFCVGNICDTRIKQGLRKMELNIFSCRPHIKNILKKTGCQKCSLFDFCGPCPISIYNPVKKVFSMSKFLDYCNFQKKSFEFVKRL